MDIFSTINNTKQLDDLMLNFSLGDLCGGRKISSAKILYDEDFGQLTVSGYDRDVSIHIFRGGYKVREYSWNDIVKMRENKGIAKTIFAENKAIDKVIVVEIHRDIHPVIVHQDKQNILELGEANEWVEVAAFVPSGSSCVLHDYTGKPRSVRRIIF